MAITLGSAYGKIEIDASGVQRSAQAAAAAMAGVSKAGRDMGSSLSLVVRDAKMLEDSLKPVGVAMAAVGAAGGALITTSTLTAARTQEMGYALNAVAKNARESALAEGDLSRAYQLSADQLNKTVEAIKKKGITTQVSLGLTAQFARYELDMSKATDLARVSQDAAVLSMENSSENLDGLLYGIITYNQRILRTHGVNVDLSKSFEEEARTLGITSDEMNEAQKVAATLNAVLREGKRIAGTYEAAMDAAGKRLRSLDRYWEEARNNLGKAYLPALNSVVDATTNLLTAFNNLSPAQQSFAAGALAVTTAVAGAAGGFILLAPKIIECYRATATFVALGKDVVTGLQLMRAGFSATQVATTGLAGSLAVALPVMLAVTAALYAAYQVYKLNQEIQARMAGTQAAWTAHLQEQVKAGKSASEIMAEYAATQERVKAAYEAAPAYVRPFIDQQKLLNGGAQEYIKTLGDMNVEQATYEAEARKTAAAMGLMVDETGSLVRRLDNYGVVTYEVVQAHYVLTEAQRRQAAGLKALTDQTALYRDAEQEVTGATNDSAAAMEKHIEEMDRLRDAQAKLADQGFTLAQSFADQNEKEKDLIDLQKQLADLDAEIAKAGPVRTALNKKNVMSAQELEAAQSKLIATEQQLAMIKRKKGETDEALEARGDALAASIENQREKIAGATGATKDSIVVIGGATKAQNEERDAILGKIAAMEEETRKQLAQQAVEALTPEMFGTGEAAAKKYADAKRALLLSTGLVTKQALAENDALGLLTTAYATGQIGPDQYAAALGRVKDAAKDGLVSLGELMSSKFLATGTKFALKNAGGELGGGLAEGIRSQSAAVGAAMTGAVDSGVESLRTAYQMKSPSLVMAAYGQDLMAGLALGFSGGATLVGAALTDALNMALLPAMAGTAMLAATMSALNGAVLAVKNSVEFELNRVLAGEAGTIGDLEQLQKIAAGSMANIGEPLQAAMFVARDGAAAAGSAVGGVVAGLDMVKSFNGMETHIWVITHEKTIVEPSEDKSGGGGTTTSGGGTTTSGGGGGRQKYQHGGDTGRGGIVRVHPHEYVLSEAMRRGQVAIPPEAMTPAAIQGVIAQAVGAGRMPQTQMIQVGPNQIASDIDIEALAYRVFEIAARKRR